MVLDRRLPRKIDGDGRTVRQLLAGRKYSIDYYQREYKWQTKQVTELIDDLAAKFLESYEPGDERAAVADYSHYFLGSIIISDKDGAEVHHRWPAATHDTDADADLPAAPAA